MSTLLLSRCSRIANFDDADTEIANGYVLVKDGWITYVGVEPPTRQVDDEIDCSHHVVVPGLINTHHHLYQTLTRAFPESNGQNLFPWLRMLYPIWSHLDDEMIYTSTRAGLAELALSGCTTSSDHLYVFPEGSEHFIDAEIEAAATIGVRFHATRGSMDLGAEHGGLPPESVVQAIDTILSDTDRLICRYHDASPGAMTRIGVAPCSPFSVTLDLMRESAELARSRQVRLHTHIAETLEEDAYSREAFGVSPVELLARANWIDKDVWLAHCVHPSESDISLLAASGASIAHCPTSNMLLGSGLAPVRRMRDEGIRVGLGVDGSASNDGNDLRAEVKQALLASRARDGVDAMTARSALRLATRGGAECLGRDDIGSIEVGKAADFAIFDADHLAMAGAGEDLIAGVVLCAVPADTVIVHGRPIARGGALLTVDTTSIAHDQRLASRRLMTRAGLEAVPSQ